MNLLINYLSVCLFVCLYIYQKSSDSPELWVVFLNMLRAFLLLAENSHSKQWLLSHSPSLLFDREEFQICRWLLHLKSIVAALSCVSHLHMMNGKVHFETFVIFRCYLVCDTVCSTSSPPVSRLTQMATSTCGVENWKWIVIVLPWVFDRRWLYVKCSFSQWSSLELSSSPVMESLIKKTSSLFPTR